MAAAEPAGRTGSFSHVTICLDGSPPGERAVPHAVAIARALGAPLTLLRVLECEPSSAAPADPLGWEFKRREARDYLERLAARFHSADAVVDSEVIEGGRAADEICRWATSHQVDLTVATTHGEGGLSPWALSGTARKLLDRAPGSVLMVPASLPEGSPGVPRYRRVLVPLDGSQAAETAVPIAERIAAAHDAELIVAHVVPELELTRIGPLEEEDVELAERVKRRNERVAQVYFDRLRGRLTRGPRAPRAVILYGSDVAGRLASLLRTESVDLVVMSASSRVERSACCGGIAVALIERALTPLLIVRARPAKAMWRVVPHPESALSAPRRLSNATS
ncbi:MAG TPA: universal stress protein [Myxococcota bacterium]|nr:universal stress protein [Myxococcota bacterium]